MAPIPSTHGAEGRRIDLEFRYAGSSGLPWGALVAGAVAVFGVFLILGTLGAALGVSAGAVGVANSEAMDAATAEKAAAAASVATWLALATQLLSIRATLLAVKKGPRGVDRALTDIRPGTLPAS